MECSDKDDQQYGEHVANCWAKITGARGSDFFVDTFYRLLFKHYPQSRSLFPADLNTQKTSLLSMIHNIVNGIDYLDELNDTLIQLGKRHKQAGVTKDMFNYFIIAFVTSANLSSNYSFTDEELNAWECAFRKISEIMLSSY